MMNISAFSCGNTHNSFKLKMTSSEIHHEAEDHDDSGKNGANEPGEGLCRTAFYIQRGGSKALGGNIGSDVFIGQNSRRRKQNTSVAIVFAEIFGICKFGTAHKGNIRKVCHVICYLIACGKKHQRHFALAFRIFLGVCRNCGIIGGKHRLHDVAHARFGSLKLNAVGEDRIYCAFEIEDGLTKLISRRIFLGGVAENRFLCDDRCAFVI